jgi:hypothetical protein
MIMKIHNGLLFAAAVVCSISVTPAFAKTAKDCTAEWYQVFRFAEPEHAERFMQEFGGEPMHPSERGKGKNWAQWKKGTYRPKPRNPYDFSE